MTRSLRHAVALRWWIAGAAALAVTLVGARPAHGDGGVTADVRQSGDARAAAFVAPMVPRVGVVDVSVLLTPQPRAAAASLAEAVTVVENDSDPVHVHARAVHLASGIERSERATRAHQGNRLLRSALLDLPRPGRWRIDVTCTERARHEHTGEVIAEWPALAFEIEVAPPLPPWRSQWPWLLIWIPLTALFLWRDRLVAMQRSAGDAREQGPGAGTIDV